MMTPQEVSSATFERAMRGYSMASVDEFLDNLTKDYETLYKENNSLKGKLKVLAEKLEEYRQVEDSLRSTLLAGQRLADQMVKEAEAKRDAILSEAEQKKKALAAEAEHAILARVDELNHEVARLEQKQQAIVAETDRLIAGEKRRLNQVKASTADFITASRALCQGQLTMLDRIPDLTPEEIVVPVRETPAPAAPVEEKPAPVAAEEPAEEIDEFAALLAETREQAPEAPKSVEPEFAAETDADPTDDVMAAIAALTTGAAFSAEEAAPEEEHEELNLWGEEPEEDMEDDPDLTETKVIKLDQLQFGRNYSSDD